MLETNASVPNVYSSQLHALTDVQGRALTAEDFIKVHTEPLYVRTKDEYKAVGVIDQEEYEQQIHTHKAVVDDEGNAVGNGRGGYLVLNQPWPSMMRGIWKEPERYKDTYWGDYPGMYTAGDGARRDRKGNFWIVGRLDDVLNVSGHRLGTAEVESALVAHKAVAEAAAVGRPHEIKGQAVVAFVTLKTGIEGTDELLKEVRNHVGKVIGAIAKPDDVYFTPALPKTRSGKIMRRLLKELVATGKATGNMTTLEDISVVKSLEKLVKKK